MKFTPNMMVLDVYQVNTVGYNYPIVMNNVNY